MAKNVSRTARALKSYDSLQELLLDTDLAGLGDAYVNFVYSLAKSRKQGRPVGGKVNNQVLAVAVEESGLRDLLPHRVDKHARANAAEALLVYAWLQDLQEFDDCIEVINNEEDVARAFAILLRNILKHIDEK